MTDLFLQDFEDIFTEKRAQLLLNERREIFGELVTHSNRTGDTGFFLISLAGLIMKALKTGERNVRN
jgi:hypothetical protein